jgi:hypothetical protein
MEVALYVIHPLAEPKEGSMEGKQIPSNFTPSNIHAFIIAFAVDNTKISNPEIHSM